MGSGDLRVNDEKRGAEAEQLLRNPLFREAFEKVEKRMLSDMVQKGLGPDEKVRLVDRLSAMYEVRTYLQQVVQTGDFAAQEEQRKSKLKSFLGK